MWSEYWKGFHQVIETVQSFKDIIIKWSDLALILVSTGIDEVIQADLQTKVTQLIIRVLIANEGLHYYQVTRVFFAPLLH